MHSENEANVSLLANPKSPSFLRYPLRMREAIRAIVLSEGDEARLSFCV